MYKFWCKNDFIPSYLSLRKNDTTGEYTCIVLKSLKEGTVESICKAFCGDFRNRFINLLGFEFKELEPYLCIDILNANVTLSNVDEDIEIANDETIISKEELKYWISLSDYARLDNYCKSMSDFYLILDILPSLCKYSIRVYLEYFLLRNVGKQSEWAEYKLLCYWLWGYNKKILKWQVNNYQTVSVNHYHCLIKLCVSWETLLN